MKFPQTKRDSIKNVANHQESRDAARVVVGKRVTYAPLVIARFWSKVDVTSQIKQCWEWRGATRGKAGDGSYGRMKVGGASLTASRIAWEIYHGEDLGEYSALHRCDNPACCNPLHIYAGSHEENRKDLQFANATKGLRISPKKRLDARSVSLIKAAISQGISDEQIAADAGLTIRTVADIRRGDRWANVQPREQHIKQIEDRIMGRSGHSHAARQAQKAARSQ